MACKELRLNIIKLNEYNGMSITYINRNHEVPDYFAELEILRVRSLIVHVPRWLHLLVSKTLSIGNIEFLP